MINSSCFSENRRPTSVSLKKLESKDVSRRTGRDSKNRIINHWKSSRGEDFGIYLLWGRYIRVCHNSSLVAHSPLLMERGFYLARNSCSKHQLKNPSRGCFPFVRGIVTDIASSLRVNNCNTKCGSYKCCHSLLRRVFSSPNPYHRCMVLEEEMYHKNNNVYAQPLYLLQTCDNAYTRYAPMKIIRIDVMRKFATFANVTAEKSFLYKG